MDGMIVLAVIWVIFRVIVSNAKKQNETRRKAEREEAGSGYQPKPAKPSRMPRAWGEWAEMLGQAGRDEQPAAAPSPWRNESAFPPVPKPSEPAPLHQEIARPSEPSVATSSLEGYVSPSGVDECHEYMLTGPAPEAPAPDAYDLGLPVRSDAPSLVRGVIFAEILTRPAQRRRVGTRG